MNTDTKDPNIPSISDPEYIKRRQGWAAEYGVAILYGDVVSLTPVKSRSLSGSLVLTERELAFNHTSSGQYGMEIIPLAEISDVSLGSSFGTKYLRIVRNGKSTDYMHNPEHQPSGLEDLSSFTETLIETKDRPNRETTNRDPSSDKIEELQELNLRKFGIKTEPKHKSVGATMSIGITLDIARVRRGLVNGILLLSDEYLSFQYKKNGETEEESVPIDEIAGVTCTYFEDAWNLRIAWGAKVASGKVTTFTSNDPDLFTLTMSLGELTKRFCPEEFVELESIADVDADFRKLALHAGHDLSEVDGQVINIVNVECKYHKGSGLLVLTDTMLAVQYSKEGMQPHKIQLREIEEIKYYDFTYSEPSFSISWDDDFQYYSGSHGDLSSLNLSLKRLYFPVEFVLSDGDSFEWNDDWYDPRKPHEEERDSSIELHKDTSRSSNRRRSSDPARELMSTVNTTRSAIRATGLSRRSTGGCAIPIAVALTMALATMLVAMF